MTVKDQLVIMDASERTARPPAAARTGTPTARSPAGVTTGGTAQTSPQRRAAAVAAAAAAAAAAAGAAASCQIIMCRSTHSEEVHRLDVST